MLYKTNFSFSAIVLYEQLDQSQPFISNLTHAITPAEMAWETSTIK